MPTKGIEGILIETHNWGKSVAFWKQLGFELVFETDHHSGQLRHPAGGPYIFLAERPANQKIEIKLGLSVGDARLFAAPPAGKVVRPFIKEHWGVMQMLLSDPDGHEVSIEAPLEGAGAGGS